MPDISHEEEYLKFESEILKLWLSFKECELPTTVWFDFYLNDPFYESGEVAHSEYLSEEELKNLQCNFDQYFSSITSGQLEHLKITKRLRPDMFHAKKGFYTYRLIIPTITPLEKVRLLSATR